MMRITDFAIGRSGWTFPGKESIEPYIGHIQVHYGEGEYDYVRFDLPQDLMGKVMEAVACIVGQHLNFAQPILPVPLAEQESEA